ncbi:hypothetical protein EVU96_25270 [Bacillus infantis]|uniref:CBO0543 family protein n=1 Tax=Bacillus infantis TaxID=324767 RepID=UPI00101C503D|nr:CBO0543 family protein [Bacillus infantis]RYI24971.1 hypothetical protein EVU96_25270 [Bacillus infantis]
MNLFYKKEKSILYSLLAFGIITLPFSFLRTPRKEWFTVFFLKGFLSSMIAMVAVAYKWIEYPVRFLPKIYRISIIFDYLLFPLTCVWYNQTSYKSNLKGILFQAFFLYSLPMTVTEYWIEKKTQLIDYKKWTWVHTYVSLSLTFLFTRGFMGIVRKLSKNKEELQEIPKD